MRGDNKSPYKYSKKKKLTSIQIDQELKTSEENTETFGEGEIKISFRVDSIGCCVYPTPEYLKRIS